MGGKAIHPLPWNFPSLFIEKANGRLVGPIALHFVVAVHAVRQGWELGQDAFLRPGMARGALQIRLHVQGMIERHRLADRNGFPASKQKCHRQEGAMGNRAEHRGYFAASDFAGFP